jgi:hypothetical protein
VISPSAKRLFLVLIVIQLFHSTEEYLFRLYDVFPPARFLTGLITSDRQIGFVVINTLFLLFGIWCYLWPVRREWPAAYIFMSVWVVVELSNGIVHPVWSVVQGSYTPGVLTSLAFLPVAILLGRDLLRAARRVRATAS